MFAVVVTFQIHPEHMAEFMPLMLANAATSRHTEVGCRQFDVCRKDNEVFLYELYDDRAAFDAHLASGHFEAFQQASAQMIASKDLRQFEEVHQ